MRPLGAKIDDRKVQEIGVNSGVGLVFVVPVRHRFLGDSGLVGIDTFRTPSELKRRGTGHQKRGARTS